MNTAPTSLMPVEQTDRIYSLDILRGMVVLGILLINIIGFGLVHHTDPTVSGGSEGWNLYAWMTTSMFVEGTMRALFSLLFGVGMFVLTDKYERYESVTEPMQIILFLNLKELLVNQLTKKTAKYSEGIEYVLMNGVLVVNNGQLQSEIAPGRPVRAPIEK